MCMRDRKAPFAFGVAAFLVPIVVYGLTLCRTVSFVDAGELCVTSHTLGIAHPTGYPLYVVLGRLFSLLPLGSIIARTNWMSAFFAALSVLFLYLTIFRVLNKKDDRRLRNSMLAFFCASSFGYTTILWSQAVITEVYSLTAFFASVLLYLAFSEFDKAPLLFAYLFGLSLTNHMSVIFLAVPCGIYLLVSRRETLKMLPVMSFLFLLGASAYIYLLVRAAQAPLFNWGNPSNIDRLVWHVTGRQYRGWMFSFDPGELKISLFYFVRLFADQYTPFLVWLPLLGVFVARKSRILQVAVLILALDVLYALNYFIPDIDAYYIPAFMMVALLSAFGLRFILSRVSRLPVLLVGILVPVAPLIAHYHKCDMSKNRIAYEYAENYLKSIDQGGLCLTNNWDIYSPLLYIRHIEGKRCDIIMIEKELLRRSWYFDYLKQEFPETYRMSEGEIESYLIELRSFEYRTLQSPVEIQRRFIYMIDSFVLNQMKKAPAYTTFINGIDSDGSLIGRGLEKIPHGLVYEFSEVSKPATFDYRNLELTESFATNTYKDERTHSNLAVYPKMMVLSGISLMNNLQYAKAKGLFREALLLDKDNLTARLNLGRAHLMLGEYSWAAENFQQVLQQYPENELARQGLSSALAKLGQK